MTTAIIVQARMGSSRLPGKVLLNLADRPVLAHVLERCHAVPGVDVVVCAVAEGSGSDRIADLATSYGAQIFFGSEADVLARYHGAAQMVGADVVMRVTSDCPLIDPAVCGQVLNLVRGGGADYACNNMPASWPHGLDCEAFTAAALMQAMAEATTAHEREHVTPWLRGRDDLVRANLVGPGGWAAEQRLTLDFPDDLAFLSALFAVLPQGTAVPTTAEVLDMLKGRPDIAALNAGRHNASRPQSHLTKEPS